MSNFHLLIIRAAFCDTIAKTRLFEVPLFAPFLRFASEPPRLKDGCGLNSTRIFFKFPVGFCIPDKQESAGRPLQSLPQGKKPKCALLNITLLVSKVTFCFF